MGAAAQLSEDKMDELGIIHTGTKDQKLLNSFRDIRNKLLRLSDYENFICLVTSLHAGDETGLLSLNLATVFAFDKSRSALVVDCSADRNILDDVIGDTDYVGLIDFIESDFDDTSILLNEVGIDRVRVVPNGKVANTRTEILESTRMRELVLELKSRYADRFIFVNAPNLSVSSEVQVLANISDMVLLEISAGTVSLAQISEAVEMIGTDKVAGVLFRDH
ncbi:MAG: Mrp family chromosome partitioning ATPase [Candidatus Azotimanducaceae bacterium]|jgi:protein-tyrosine kinase